MVLPAHVREVHIFANNDEPGRLGAERAAVRFVNQGRKVVLRYPPEAVKDFNDLLRMRTCETA